MVDDEVGEMQRESALANFAKLPVIVRVCGTNRSPAILLKFMIAMEPYLDRTSGLVIMWVHNSSPPAQPAWKVNTIDFVSLAPSDCLTIHHQ